MASSAGTVAQPECDAHLLQAQQREQHRVSDIVHRTLEKDDKLATLREHRDHVNACKSLERKLDLDLKREKVYTSSVCVCFDFSQSRL